MVVDNKVKLIIRVNRAINSIQQIGELVRGDGFDKAVLDNLIDDVQESLNLNKQRMLLREIKPTKNDDYNLIEFEDEESELQFENIPLERRRVLADKSDRSIFELYNKFIEGDLILQPEFQRYYIWDDKKASLLIESILLEVPLPIFYLAEENSGKYSVIDGQQRLVSLFRFLNPLKIGNQDIEMLRLRGLQVLTEFNNRRFIDLSKEIQKKFTGSTVRVIEIRRDSHPDVKFEIFERLNTGAVKLNDQELRNCVFRGSYNYLLKELADDKDFQFLLGINEAHPRMVDRELILRFLAFHHSTYLKYHPPMKQFLNKEMQSYRELNKDQEKEIRIVFRKCVDLSKTVFGEYAFRRFIGGSSEKRPQGQWEKRKVNRALFDLIMCGFSQYEKNQIVPKGDIIREELLWLMTKDEDFRNSILFTTDKTEKVKLRFKKWSENLEVIVGLSTEQSRNFTLQFKEQLWNTNPTCAICGQRIHILDDGEVDHIEHYWRGGKTIPSNARLTHRYCNRARGGR